MAKDTQEKALLDAQRAQAEFERVRVESLKARQARRESFARAKATGLSLAQIADAVNLHRSRVDQILHES